MSVIYELIGRFVVRALWWRFGNGIKLAGAAALAGVLVAGYLLSHREPPEG
jgi:hypothetical protein